MNKNNLGVRLFSVFLGSVWFLSACSPESSKPPEGQEQELSTEKVEAQPKIEGLVNNQQEFNDALSSAKPGDTIILADGTWQDFEMVVKAEGTEENPITLTAQTKGKVILSGKSSLKLAGKYIVVSGLVFKDGYSPTGEVISYRVDKENLAYHSRVTEVVIDNFNNPCLLYTSPSPRDA